MKKIIFLFILCFLFGRANAQLTQKQKIDSPANGKTITDFKMYTSESDTVNFYSINADIIILDLWATWCGPCKQQAPKFDSLRTKYGSDKIKFVSISIDKNMTSWEKYVSK